MLRFCLVAALLAQSAYGFPTDQHYRVTSEPAQLGLDSADRWDSEAASDFVTYQRPINWELNYWRQNRIYDLTVGSISGRQFLKYQRLKIYHDLSDRLQFRLHWLVERDFEQDRSATPVELKFKLTNQWAISAFGETSFYKEENDVGGSLFYYPTPDQELRVSGLWGDFQRNQRTVRNDSWLHAPAAFTLSYLFTPIAATQTFHRAELHWEHPSVRAVAGKPTARLSYHSMYFVGVRSLDGGRSLGWRLFYDDSEAIDITNDLVRRRKRSLNQVEYQMRMGPHVLRPGINFFYREGREDNNQEIVREILPTLWMEFLPRIRSWGTALPSFGYDTTFFQQQTSLRTNENTWEHRLNGKYEMLFKNSATLSLLFTFDLDRFGTSETWEGGAAQFSLMF